MSWIWPDRLNSVTLELNVVTVPEKGVTNQVSIAACREEGLCSGTNRQTDRQTG